MFWGSSRPHRFCGLCAKGSRVEWGRYHCKTVNNNPLDLNIRFRFSVFTYIIPVDASSTLWREGSYFYSQLLPPHHHLCRENRNKRGLVTWSKSKKNGSLSPEPGKCWISYNSSEVITFYLCLLLYSFPGTVTSLISRNKKRTQIH